MIVEVVEVTEISEDDPGVVGELVSHEDGPVEPPSASVSRVSRAAEESAVHPEERSIPSTKDLRTDDVMGAEA